VIRRLQLLPAEGQASGNRLAVIVDRIRDGLLRDNKVVPVVLGFLSLLIFAWLIAGAIIGSPDEEEQATNQSSLAQGEDSESGGQETPAPGVENRDSDSYSAFESKDPFRSLVPKAGEDKAGVSKAGEPKGGESKAGEPKAGEPKAGEPKAGEPKAGEPKAGEPKGATPPRDNSPGSLDGNGPREGQNGEDSGDQSFPGAPDFGSGTPQGSPGQGDNGQNGNGGLFNSGGDLPVP
jgi:uncharacterized low-complexity protein